MRFLKQSTWVFILGATFHMMDVSASSISVAGTSDLWLAGMPNGTSGGGNGSDVAPYESPVLVSGLSLIQGNLIKFTVTGGTSQDPDLPIEPPDGSSVSNNHQGATNGISDITAPYSSLIGVFLSFLQPDNSTAPSTLDFSTAVSLDYTTLAPLLQQAFFIGDGLTSGGIRQQIEIPSGATRLYLGSMDSAGDSWNNIGSFTVDITENTASIPEPSSLALFVIGFGAFSFRCRLN